MTEQEFKTTIEQLLINRTKRTGDPSWMKTRILEHAKAYAAAQVSEKDARIQELRDELLRLTKDQETNCEEYVKTLTQDANYGLNQEIAELKSEIAEYKEARECLKVATDAEIAALKDANGRLKTQLSIAGAAHFAETSALKADNVRKLQIQDTMHANAEAVLKDEIKRLREALSSVKTLIAPLKDSHPSISKAYDLLSPKDGTEININSPKNED